MKQDHLARMCQLNHQHLNVNLLPGNLLQHLKLGPLDQDHDEYYDSNHITAFACELFLYYNTKMSVKIQ